MFRSLKKEKPLLLDGPTRFVRRNLSGGKVACFSDLVTCSFCRQTLEGYSLGWNPSGPCSLQLLLDGPTRSLCVKNRARSTRSFS